MERQRAQAAHDLIDYYGQFSRGDTARLDALKKDGREGRRQVAILLRRLTTVAREVDLPTAEKVRSPNKFLCPVTAEQLADARKYRQVLREVREGHALSF